MRGASFSGVSVSSNASATFSRDRQGFEQRKMLEDHPDP